MRTAQPPLTTCERSSPYTGQRSMVGDFGLMYYNARWYDPLLGRFTQPDTLIPGAGNPMAFDRYGYVFNNPISLIDPTGHKVICLDGEQCFDTDPGSLVLPPTLPPIPKIELKKDSNDNFDPRATWRNLEDWDILARAILSEENVKLLDPGFIIDAIGVGWVIYNRTNPKDTEFRYARNNLFAAITSGGQVLGMGGFYSKEYKKIVPSNAVYAADPESYNGKNEWFDGQARECYWKAVEIAKRILSGSISDPTRGARFYSDAYIIVINGEKVSVPYEDGRTRFRYKSESPPSWTINELSVMNSVPWAE